MKKAIMYRNEECVIIKTVSVYEKRFAFFVAVSSKKIIYLKENIVHNNITYASLDKLVNIFPQYKTPSMFNTKVMLDTFVNTVNYKIRTCEITDSDELLELINKFEKLLIDPYIRKMTDVSNNKIFSKVAMAEVTNTIKKLDSTYRKSTLAELLASTSKTTNDVFLSQNWLDDDIIDNKKLVYESIEKSNKAHKRSPIDFLFNNKVLNVYMIIMIIAVVGFATCLELLSSWKDTGEITTDEIDEIREEALIEDPVEQAETDKYEVVDPTSNQSNSNNNSNSNTTSNKETSRFGQDYIDYSKISMVNVDFNKLKKTNKDTVAWIYVNNTNVNYPVVQTTNNSYYLNHSFKRTSNVAGWIYGDYRSNFSNFKRNTVIYGHGRTDQVMFGSLSKTLNASWYKNKNNQVIKLATPTNDTLWQIVSIYVVPAEAYYLSHNFENDASYQKWIDTMISRSIYNFGYKPTVKDKFLTLSTCKDFKGNRIVVQAILVKNEKK